MANNRFPEGTRAELDKSSAQLAIHVQNTRLILARCDELVTKETIVELQSDLVNMLMVQNDILNKEVVNLRSQINSMSDGIDKLEKVLEE